MYSASCIYKIVLHQNAWKSNSFYRTHIIHCISLALGNVCFLFMQLIIQHWHISFRLICKIHLSTWRKFIYWSNGCLLTKLMEQTCEMWKLPFASTMCISNWVTFVLFLHQIILVKCWTYVIFYLAFLLLTNHQL